MVLEETIFPRLRYSSKILWVFSILLHLTVAMLFVGHIRLFYDPLWFWALLNLDEAGVQAFASLMGGISGTIFMIALLGLFIRRLRGPVKEVSVPIDYITLLVLLAIGITGDYMRFVMHIDLASLQTYFASLVALQPVLTPTLFEPAFILHYTIVQGFLIYFPFSKLVHVIGSVITNFLAKR
jgi:nitrate reductase gamma subunit